jgi:integrase
MSPSPPRPAPDAALNGLPTERATVPPRRGRPRLPTPARRVRAQSPFLPPRKTQQALPATAPLRQALEVLPDVPSVLVGELMLEDLPIQVPGVRFAVSADQAVAAAGVLRLVADHSIQPYAANSRRSIRSDWRHWVAFCAVCDKVAMPIAFEDLKAFFDALIAAGYQRASLEHLMFTLKLASQLWSCPPPDASLAWRWYWQHRCRETLSRDQRQAPPLNIEDLNALAAVTSPTDPRALRDLAFASVDYDLLARPSELATLRWDLIEFETGGAGGATYRLPRSKADQQGEGAELYLMAATVRRLQAWNAHRFPENPYVFHALPRYAGQPLDRTRPLSVREAGRIFERIRRRTGSPKLWSGHSGRVGGSQDMTRAGMELPAIMQAGRWKSPAMPARYSAKELAARAGRRRAASLRHLQENEG